MIGWLQLGHLIYFVKCVSVLMLLVVDELLALFYRYVGNWVCIWSCVWRHCFLFMRRYVGFFIGMSHRSSCPFRTSCKITSLFLTTLSFFCSNYCTSIVVYIFPVRVETRCSNLVVSAHVVLRWIISLWAGLVLIPVIVIWSYLVVERWGWLCLVHFVIYVRPWFENNDDLHHYLLWI